MSRLCVLLSLVVLLAPAIALPEAGDTTADRVLGQLDFRGATLNGVDVRGLWLPAGVAVDLSATPNRVYVADSANSRVLAWADAEAFANGAPADLVIGQPDAVSSACHGLVAGRLLCGPTAVAVDAAGNLWVADTGNHRVLAYRDPFATDREADAVFGTTDPRCAASPGFQNLCGPQAIAVDRDGNLWVADTLYNRVVVFERALTTDAGIDRVVISASRDAVCRDAAGNPAALCFPVALAVDPRGHLYVADRERLLVVEEPLDDATVRELGRWERRCRERGVPSAGELCLVSGLAAGTAGNLWVADTGNHRVLEFDSPFATDLVADRVLGRPADPRAACGDPADGFLCSPAGIAVHKTSAIAVADRDNCRVLIFVRPLADLEVDRVLGSSVGSFAGCQAECAAGGLCRPTFLATDGPGNLWATTENTVLGFDRPLATDALPDRGLVSAGFLCERNAEATRESVCHPAGLAVDAAGTLWVADQVNSRVLGFDAPLGSDLVADRVLGQGGSFGSAACNNGGLSARSLCGPGGVAFDGAGRLWVVDSGNNRVLRFNAPLSQQAAARVVGQADFRTGEINRLDARGLFLPASVAVDRSVSPNRLWVADTENSRVLGWRDATGFANGAPADLILGQPGPTTSACNTGGLSARSLCRPRGLAIDAAGINAGGGGPAEGVRTGVRIDGAVGAAVAAGCERVALADDEVGRRALGHGAGVGPREHAAVLRVDDVEPVRHDRRVDRDRQRAREAGGVHGVARAGGQAPLAEHAIGGGVAGLADLRRGDCGSEQHGETEQDGTEMVHGDPPVQGRS